MVTPVTVAVKDRTPTTTTENKKSEEISYSHLRSLCADGIAVSQKNDPTLVQCFSQIGKKGSLFFLKEDLLYRRLSEDAKCNVVCLVLPTVCRLPVMKIAHEMGHFAAKKTWQRLKKLFFWSNIRKDAIQYCISCTDCQKQRRITVWDRVPIQAV